MSQQKGYVDPEYLDMIAEVVAKHKRRTYELMDITAGDAVLDVGCGPGTDTIPLAGLVGPTGRVVGVDFDPEMLAEADRRAAEASVDDRVEHRQADATALPFGENISMPCGPSASSSTWRIPHPPSPRWCV
jgi:ubiquinone/menaquinone biosynthesis C-methylase UbiE